MQLYTAELLINQNNMETTLILITSTMEINNAPGYLFR